MHSLADISPGSIAPPTPSRPQDGQTGRYTLGTDGTPASEKFAERPLTPVPHWPLPPLKRENNRPESPGTIKVVRPSGSRGTLTGRDTRPRSPRLAGVFLEETARFLPTPPLPDSWTDVHDRAICVLDACGYSLNETVRKLRCAFQELAGHVLTPLMVDKRLRMLDQDIEIDYFQIGLNRLNTKPNESDQSGHSRNKEASSNRGHISNKPSVPHSPTFSRIAPEWEESRMSLCEALREGKKPLKVRLTSIYSRYNTLTIQVNFDESDTSSPTSTASTRTTSKTNTNSTVHSHPFGTGFLSYRTKTHEDLRE